MVSRLVKAYGPVNETAEYACRIDGHWAAVPWSTGSGVFACVGRIDIFAQVVGIDLREVFPTTPEMGPDYDRWTWDAFLRVAEQCAKAGYPFGLPLRFCDDATAWLCVLFRSYGAELVDAAGNVAVDSDEVRTVLDYVKRLAPYLPPDVYSWTTPPTTARWSLGVARSSSTHLRPGPRPDIGSQCWHFPLPAGPGNEKMNMRMVTPTPTIP